MKRKLMLGVAAALLGAVLLSAQAGGLKNDAGIVPVAGEEANRARLIVLDDMGCEPDEVQQMVHVLMDSSEFELEGLLCVTSTSLRPEKKEPYLQKLHPELWYQLIDAYEKVYPNLNLHATGWLTPDYLRGIVACGQTGYGLASVGAGKSSAGSKLIIAAVTKPDPRPVYFAINAGANTLAQALYDFQATHSPSEMEDFVAKLRVYEDVGQDDSGAWICHQFTNIFWIRSVNETRCYGGGPLNTTLGPCVWRPYPNTPVGQDDWANANIRTGHGALGALYPQRIVKGNPISFIEGGGTIPWMGLVCRGLTYPSEPSWGGWSGRYAVEKTPNVRARWAGINAAGEKYKPWFMYAEASDHWKNPMDQKTYDDVCAAVWRWRMAMWNDFKARMDWCVQPYAKANHPPHAVLNGDATDAILKLSAKPGDVMKFDASGSTDPDKDALRYSWWIYPEAGRRPYGKALPIANASSDKIEVTIPPDAAGKELHLILEVWDQSAIVPLVDYRRVVIDVAP